MGLLTRLPAVILLLAALVAPQARAMQFKVIELNGGKVAITAIGPIVEGDAKLLMRTIKALPAGRTLVAMLLDSGGGSVVEGYAMATLIHETGLIVVVDSNSMCASACFMMFAASPKRRAGAHALIGVHSASIDHKENADSKSVTVEMARLVAKFGVPAQIIGKMVVQQPKGMEWLQPDDLEAMDVTIISEDDNDDSATVTAAPSPPAPSQPPPAPPARIAAPPPAVVPLMPPPAAPPFGHGISSPTPLVVPVMPPPAAPPGPMTGPNAMAEGQGDRRAWENWMAGLSGLFRQGASFAFAQLELVRPAPCFAANGASLGEFSQGCDAARRRLVQVAARMHQNPDYRVGWGGTLQAAALPGEVRYDGAFFCGSAIGKLVLKLQQQTGDAIWRGVMNFAPQPTSPSVPYGAFTVEGRLQTDETGLTLSLLPGTWVTQPPGYPWFGVRAHSDDRGLSYAGRVVGRTDCTTVTLRQSTALH